MVRSIKLKTEDIDKKKREKSFQKKLNRQRKELEELAFIQNYQKKRNFVVKYLERDMKEKLTLAEMIIIKNALIRSMKNNKELEKSSYGGGKRNKECHVVEEAEALYAFYRYHGYNLEYISFKDEKYILNKICKARKEGLHSFTLQDYNFINI